MGAQRDLQRQLQRGVQGTLIGGGAPWDGLALDASNSERARIRNAVTPTLIARYAILSVWFKPVLMAGAAEQQLFMAGTGANNDVPLLGGHITTAGEIHTVAGYNYSSGFGFPTPPQEFITGGIVVTPTMVTNAGATALTDGAWNHILMTLDVGLAAATTAYFQIAVNGKFITEDTYAADGTLYQNHWDDAGGTAFYDSIALGSLTRSAASEFFDGVIDEVWMDNTIDAGNSLYDLNTQANIDVFWNGGVRPDHGTDGSDNYGSQPTHYYGGTNSVDAASFLVNRGSFTGHNLTFETA